MSKARTIRFDANRAFTVTVLAVGLLGASFAAGFRLGQEVPVPLTASFSSNASSGSDHIEPLVAPEQRIPVDTYTFYEQTRTVERAPVVPVQEPVTRVLDREPVQIEPSEAEAAPSAGVARAPSDDVARPRASAGSDVPAAAPAGGAAGIVPADLDDAPAMVDPGSIERVAVVAPSGAR